MEIQRNEIVKIINDCLKEKGLSDLPSILDKEHNLVRKTHRGHLLDETAPPHSFPKYNVDGTKIEYQEKDYRDSRDYSSLEAAIEAMGTNRVSFVIPIPITVSSTVSFPYTCKVKFEGDGQLSVVDGGSVTIRSMADPGPRQIFNLSGTGILNIAVGAVAEVSPVWFGADPLYVEDSTAAFQDTLDSVSYGQVIHIQGGQYKITDTLTWPSSLRLYVYGAGYSETSLYFNPTANSKTMLATSNQDNCVLADIKLYCSNSGSKVDLNGISLPSGTSAFKLYRVWIAGFNKYGVNMDSGKYHRFIDCVFTINENSAVDTHNAIAINGTTYTNAVSVERCRFSGNDIDICMPTTSRAVQIRANSFENSGDSGNTYGLAYSIYFSNAKGLSIEGNYFEACRCADLGGVICLDDSHGARIIGNTFDGDYSGTTYSESFLYLYGSKRVKVSGNYFSEVKDYFIRFFGAGSAYLENNTYIDGGVEKTSYADIMALISNPEYVQLDVPIAFTWNPGSLGDGVGETSGNITASGLRAGDAVIVGAPYDVNDMLFMGTYTADNIARIRLQNECGSTRDLASGSWKIWILKNF